MQRGTCYSEITKCVEVQQVTIHEVNEYLAHGYVLLEILHLTYAVGRPWHVERWQPAQEKEKGRIGFHIKEEAAAKEEE